MILGFTYFFFTGGVVQKIFLIANTDWYLYNFRLSLAKSLAEKGNQVIFVSPAGKFVPAIQEAGFEWIAWEVGRISILPWIELKALRSLAEIYWREKPDLVHHHTLKAVVYGTQAAKKNTIPTINSIAGLGYVFSSDAIGALLLRPLLKFLFRVIARHPACLWIFENDGDRNLFLNGNIITPDQSYLINSVGVDIERFTPTPEPEGIPRILYAGRLLRDKGVEVLVEAARILHQSAEVEVILAGEPDPGNPTTIEEETLRAWEGEGVIKWVGWQEDTKKVYRDCHIATLPTFYGEGVPTVLLEAAASGRPVVATEIAGCRSIVKDGYNGFLVPPNDPQKLAQALKILVLDPELRKRMGAAGRQLVEDKFADTKINGATHEVYQDLTG